MEEYWINSNLGRGDESGGSIVRNEEQGGDSDDWQDCGVRIGVIKTSESHQVLWFLFMYSIG